MFLSIAFLLLSGSWTNWRNCDIVSQSETFNTTLNSAKKKYFKNDMMGLFKSRYFLQQKFFSTFQRIGGNTICVFCVMWLLLYTVHCKVLCVVCGDVMLLRCSPHSVWGCERCWWHLSPTRAMAPCMHIIHIINITNITHTPAPRVSVMISPDNLLLTRRVPGTEKHWAVAPSWGEFADVLTIDYWLI